MKGITIDPSVRQPKCDCKRKRVLIGERSDHMLSSTTVRVNLMNHVLETVSQQRVPDKFLSDLCSLHRSNGAETKTNEATTSQHELCQTKDIDIAMLNENRNCTSCQNSTMQNQGGHPHLASTTSKYHCRSQSHISCCKHLRWETEYTLSVTSRSVLGHKNNPPKCMQLHTSHRQWCYYQRHHSRQRTKLADTQSSSS